MRKTDETREEKTQRAREILRKLKRHRPDARIELNFSTPLELLVATVLAAQCTDQRVNEVTRSLFMRYRSAQDYAQADPHTLEREIEATGFFRQKAKALIGIGRELGTKHGGKVPQTMEELVALPGVGRKTANVVLGSALGIAAGIVVDTHVQRVAAMRRIVRSCAVLMWRLFTKGPSRALLLWKAYRCLRRAASSRETLAAYRLLEFSGGEHGVASIPDVCRVGRAVHVASRLLPARAACLAKSMACCMMLRERGVPCRVRIGVKPEGEALTAHAWVEYLLGQYDTREIVRCLWRGEEGFVALDADRQGSRRALGCVQGSFAGRVTPDG
jgi:endonuclease-3